MGVLDALLDARLGEAFTPMPGLTPGQAQQLQSQWTVAKPVGQKGSRSGRKTAHRGAGPGGGQFVSSGSSGAAVQGVQHKVGAQVDGQFGSRTRQAVVQFQRQHGLTVDGVVGHQTAAAMRGVANASSVKTGALTSADLKALSAHGGRARTVRARVVRGGGSSRKSAQAPVRIGGGYRI